MILPKTTIIVPGHNASKTLEACLSSLRSQEWPQDCLELIYVDDASTDESPEIGARFADHAVTQVGSPRGPAAARNLGVKLSCGEIIVFADADIVAPRHALRDLVQPLIDNDSLDAVFGSYNRDPQHDALISQYRNLLHHYVHQTSREEATTFWAGFGAIRRCSFERTGGFNAALYPAPMIEDIELGHRMRAAGMRIRLEKSVQVTHLKKWTTLGMVRTDILRRGIPWMRLILSENGRSKEIGDLNLGASATVSVALTWSSLIAIILCYWHPVLVPVSLLLLGICILINLPVYAFFGRVRGFVFALKTIPLHFLYHCCNGISAVIGALSRIFIDHPLPGLRGSRSSWNSLRN